MTTIVHGKSHASYTLSSKGRRVGLDIKNYQQEDDHSCGFTAALTVARYFKPSVKAHKVLEAVRPSINHGVDRFKLIKGLEALGITVEYRTDLTIVDLHDYSKDETPVILSVWPDKWLSDHWTIFMGMRQGRVYLTNYHSLTIKQFFKEWSDPDMRSKGNSQEGLVCTYGA